MIVSHRHQFIFVHLGRTGGRSLTAALAEHCGPDDVVTKVSKDCPARNAERFGRHDSAAAIRAKVGEVVWRGYFKFAFERNPWEKIVSRYWHYAGAAKKKPYKKVWENAFGRPLSFRQWFWMKVWTGRLFGLGHIRFPAHYRDYTEDGKILIDFIGRCENRREHVAWLSQRLGIPIRDDKRIGADFHKVRTPYVELFDPPMRRVVERIYRDDLALLGYRFGEPPPREPLIIENGRVVAGARPAPQAAGVCRAA